MAPQRDSEGCLAAVQRFSQRTHGADYLGFVLLLAAYLLVQFFITPFHRMFSLDDHTIQFPHALIERVPVSWLFLYAGLIPLVLLIIWASASRSGWHKAHVTILGLLISLILTSFLTDVVKNAVGRPRPDLLARCKAKEGTPKDQLVTFEICTETDHHVLHDGWRSFPSGHSSFAFSGLGYLAMFVAGQTHVFRPRVDLARVLLALAPLIGAGLIAISRLADYRHDVYDVTIGSALGLTIAYHTYRRYYPGLRSSKCDAPYPPLQESNKHTSKSRDEENGFISDGDQSEGERIPLQMRRSQD